MHDSRTRLYYNMTRLVPPWHVKCRWSVPDTAVDVVNTVIVIESLNESTVDRNVGLEQAYCFSVQAVLQD